MQNVYLYIANVVSTEINGTDYLELLKDPELNQSKIKKVCKVIAGTVTPEWVNCS